MRLIMTAAVCVLVASPSRAARFERRTVTLSAGGTIDMSGAHGRSASRPAVGLGARPEGIQIFSRPLDSGVLGPRHWKRIIGAVYERVMLDKDAAVLKHGTDTLEQTGLILSLVFDGRIRRPVVMTGAWTPPDQPGSDAAQNVGRAIGLATSRNVPPVVYAVFGDEIHLASRIKKARAEAHDGRPYFESVGGPVGRFAADGQPRLEPAFLARAWDWRGIPGHPRNVEFARVEVSADEAGVRLRGGGLTLGEGDYPRSLDPLKAALKLSMLAGADEPRLAERMGEDLAGEVVPGERAVFLLPLPAPWPARLAVVLATQDMRAAQVQAAARRLGAGPAGPAADASARALEDSHPLLGAIGAAVRGGVEVVIGSNAFRSATDLSLYEIGHILARVGARDSGGRDLAALLSEAPPRPRLVIVGSGSGHLPVGTKSYVERLHE